LADPVTLAYFNGQQPPSSTDFTAANNAQRLSALTLSLINFFGSALGCTDGTILLYTGGSMKAVHATMGVTTQAFDLFNKFLLEVTAGAGVSSTDNAAILAVLETTRADITGSNPPSPGPGPAPVAPGLSICDKYSAALALSNKALVSLIVSDTVGKLVGNDITLPYFNGKFPAGTTDFTTNPALLANLQTHLVEFFGGALGCTDGTITPYAGASLQVVHKSMKVSPAAFDTFNSLLLSVLVEKGVASPDVNTVGGVLESTRTAVVSPYTADSFKPNYLSGGTVAGIVIGAIIVAAIMGAACVGLVFIEGSLPKFH